MKSPDSPAERADRFYISIINKHKPVGLTARAKKDLTDEFINNFETVLSYFFPPLWGGQG